jgi:MFS family permease
MMSSAHQEKLRLWRSLYQHSSCRFVLQLCLHILSQLISIPQMLPFGSGIATASHIAADIGASESEGAWIAASYPMAQGAFVLIGGRFGDVHGHKGVLLTGAVWWVIWSLVTGFAKSIFQISLFRGLTGMGAAFIVPNAVALLMHTFPPGKSRNIAMGLFGAMAPIGAAGGSVIAALLVQLAPWKMGVFLLRYFGSCTILTGCMADSKCSSFRQRWTVRLDWCLPRCGWADFIQFRMEVSVIIPQS